MPETDGAKVLPISDQVGFYLASTHQMAPQHTSEYTGLLLVYRPLKDERLSWPSWLTCSGRFTHIVVTRRLQAERRTGSVRRRKSGVLPTVLRNQWVEIRLVEMYVSALDIAVHTAEAATAAASLLLILYTYSSCA